MNPAEPRPLVRFSLVCVALLCAVPFLQPYHRNPLTTFYSEWLAFALGIGVMAVLLDRRTWEQAEVPWAALSPFALAVLLVIHGMLGWSPYPGQALTGALYLIWTGVLIFAARALVQARGGSHFLTLVATGLVAGALLSAVIGVIQHFNMVTPLNAYIARPVDSAISGNLGQANHFAAYLTLGLLSLVYLRERRCVPLAVAVACALPMLFVLGLSGSRSIWLYLFAAFALAAWFRFASPNRSDGTRLFLACGVLIIVFYTMQILAGLVWFKPAERETVTTVGRLFSGAASVSDRFDLWRAAWAMLLDQPLFGTGWGTFPWIYFQEYTANVAAAGQYTLYHHAHNLPLHLLAETGLVGAALVALPLLVWLRQVTQNVFDIHQWWLFAALAVIGLHSLLEFPLWYAYFLGIGALLLGASHARAFKPKLARVGRMLAFAVVLAGSFNLVTVWLDYRDFERVFYAPPEALRESELTTLMQRLHRNPVLMPYIELASALPLAVDEADLEQRLLLTKRAMHFAPLATLLYRQVLLLALAGRVPEARALLVRAQRAYPNPPPEFGSDLARGLREHPDRYRPLLESDSHRASGRN